MKKELTHSLVIAVKVRYRKGMPIVNAMRDVLDDLDVPANVAARIKNTATKELKANSDWDYSRPEVI